MTFFVNLSIMKPLNISYKAELIWLLIQLVFFIEFTASSLLGLTVERSHVNDGFQKMGGKK